MKIKLYYFKPNDCGDDYFVMSDSRENAIKAVTQYLSSNVNIRYCVLELKSLMCGELPKGYTLKEYNINSVVRRLN